MITIKEAAIMLIEVLRKKEPNNVISNKWNDLAECINSYKNYEDVPNVKEVSEALFLYAQNYTNKVDDEECIRSFNAFCLLKRATEETIGKDRIESFIRLTLLLSRKLKYLMPIMHYTMPRHISDYGPAHTPQLTPEQVNLVQKNYEAIKVYLYKNVVNSINDYPIEEDLINRFNVNSTSFFENSKKEPYNVLELSEGKELLDSCYRRISEYGKYTLYVIKEGLSSFNKRSRSQIKGDFKFLAKTCLLTERGQQYNEASTSSTFTVRMIEDRLEISTTGIKEEFIRPFLSQPISHTVIEKLDHRMEIQLEHRVARGDGDNVPGSLDIVVDNDKVVELQFFFIVGEKGWPRYINFYGDCEWLNDGVDNNALMSDFNFNLDSIIQYEIKEKYLPVRAMTADDMGILGDVAVVGCNPIKHHNLGRITTSNFDIVENDDTEYFVFSKHSPLYNDLVRRVHAMDTWIPKSYAYNTIKGWVHGVLRIVHIDKNLY